MPLPLFGPNSPLARVKRAKAAIYKCLGAVSRISHDPANPMAELRLTQELILEMLHAIYKELP